MKVCQTCGTRYGDAVSFCPRDSEPLQLDHQSRVGQTLDGQYEIEAFIAEGGMGAVFRARHTLLGDRVAIKLLPPEMRHNAEWLRRFQREGQAARRFRHPNAVIVHDLRTSSEGEVYLVMEYVEGQTLDQYARSRGGRLSLTESLPIIEQVASVLDAAHSTGVVHRDLKPSNIMITADGRSVKLLDLGIARINSPAGDATALTRSGQFLGTPYYMAPEQWGEMPRDRIESIDGRADIYSLGVVVYEMTAGSLPFQQSSVLSLRHAHCKERPRPLAEVLGSVPVEWSRAIERAMSKDRSDRQDTAGQFASELRAACNAHAPGASTLDERAAAPTIRGEFGKTIPAGGSTQEDGMPFIDATHLPMAQPLPAVSKVETGAKSEKAKRSWTLGLTSSRGCQVTLTVAAVAVIAMVAGGYSIMRSLWTGRSPSTASAPVNSNSVRPRAGETGSAASPNRNAAASTNTAAPASGEPFIRYHLLLSPSVLDEQKRTAGEERVAAGQSLQFVFTASQSGYIYMIGRDSQKSPVVIPLGDLLAVKQVEAGEEIQAPALARVKLDDAPGEEIFTVIFSKEPLKFSFASETLPFDGTFRKLTTEDRELLEDLRRNSPSTAVTFSGERNLRTALVKLSGENAGDKAVVFDIKINLRRE
ncbi:MAG TPA: protein kinase [Pyrinomonadaceae bacterium]|jgi:serine/threonine-protein kinase